MSINLNTRPHPGSNSNISGKRRLMDRGKLTNNFAAKSSAVQQQQGQDKGIGETTLLHPPLSTPLWCGTGEILSSRLWPQNSVQTRQEPPGTDGTMHHNGNSIIILYTYENVEGPNKLTCTFTPSICSKMSWGVVCLGGTTWRYPRHRLQDPSLQDLVWVLERACVGFGQLLWWKTPHIAAHARSSTFAIVGRILQPAAVTWVPQCG